MTRSFNTTVELHESIIQRERIQRIVSGRLYRRLEGEELALTLNEELPWLRDHGGRELFLHDRDGTLLIPTQQDCYYSYRHLDYYPHSYRHRDYPRPGAPTPQWEGEAYPRWYCKIYGQPDATWLLYSSKELTSAQVSQELQCYQQEPMVIGNRVYSYVSNEVYSILVEYRCFNVHMTGEYRRVCAKTEDHGYLYVNADVLGPPSYYKPKPDE